MAEAMFFSWIWSYNISNIMGDLEDSVGSGTFRVYHSFWDSLTIEMS